MGELPTCHVEFSSETLKSHTPVWEGQIVQHCDSGGFGRHQMEEKKLRDQHGKQVSMNSAPPRPF